MEEIKIKDKMNNDLNFAFSINYLILDILDKITPKGKTNFTREDIFAEKSMYENYLFELHKIYAEAREETFDTIQKNFNSMDYEKVFKQNNEILLNLYNETMGKQVKYDEVFSEKDIENWDFFTELEEKISNSDLSDLKATTLGVMLYQYLSFYNDYKNWRSVTEIFEVLKNDFNSYGAQSFTYGKPQNQEILKVNCDFLKSVLDKCDSFVAKYYKQYNKQLKKLSKTDDPNVLGVPENFSVLEQCGSLDKLVEYCDLFENRMRSANSTPNLKKPLSAKILEFINSLKNEPTEPVKVKDIYIHKIEMLDFLSILSMFPEFSEIAKNVSITCLGEDLVSDLEENMNTQSEKQ